MSAEKAERAEKDDKRKRLTGIELFKHCAADDLDALAAITEDRRLPAGHVLCDQGRVAQECYIVIDGQAEVTVNGRRVASIGPGETVGEMGLLDHLPRSATVTATTPMQVYVIEAKRFEQVLQPSGVARALLVLLSRRIRELEHGREGLSAGYSASKSTSENRRKTGEKSGTPSAAISAGRRTMSESLWRCYDRPQVPGHRSR